MKKNFKIAVFGLILGALSGWSAGCTNHGGYTLSDADLAAEKAREAASQKAPSASLSIAGSWACDDSQCDPDTIKTISQNLSGIQTQATERHTSNGVEGACRIQETSKIAVSNSINTSNGKDADPSSVTLSGNLNLGPSQVIDSPDNTHDCQEYYALQNQNLKPTTDSIMLILNSSLNCPGKLSINGVCYRNLSDPDLKSINSARAAKDARNASIAGDWTSLDSDKAILQASISSNLKSVELDVLMIFKPKNENCRVQEMTALSLETPGESNPDQFNGNLSNDVLTLVPSVENAEDCQELIENANRQNPSSTPIAFERDGNQYLVMNGQRFVRKLQNNSEN